MRILIAVDQKGVHLRETLCVIHRGESGEVHYRAKPIHAPAWFRPVMFVIGILARLISESHGQKGTS